MVSGACAAVRNSQSVSPFVMNALPGARTGPRKLGNRPCEMALVGKTAGPKPPLAATIAYCTGAALRSRCADAEPSMRDVAVVCPECARELTGRHAAFPRELGQWDLSIQIRVEVFFGTTFWPRRETARSSGHHFKAAIDLSNVKSDGQHDVIDNQHGEN